MENSINHNEINQGLETMRNIFIEFGRYLEREGLDNTLENYEEFINLIPPQYDRDEIVKIVNCFFADADVEENNIVLVNKNNKDNVIVLNLDFKYFWSYNNGLAIHIKDKENKIDININNVVELEDDTLELGNWIMDIL